MAPTAHRYCSPAYPPRVTTARQRRIVIVARVSAEVITARQRRIVIVAWGIAPGRLATMS